MIDDIRANRLKMELEEAERLLSIANTTLARYWFEGSYNNEDVIECSKRIEEFLERKK